MVGEKVGFGGFGPMPVGTPSQVADVMEKWFREADIDGFNIQCEVSTIAPEQLYLTDTCLRHVQPRIH